MASESLRRGFDMFFAQEFFFFQQEHGPPRGSIQAKRDVLTKTVLGPLRGWVENRGGTRRGGRETARCERNGKQDMGGGKLSPVLAVGEADEGGGGSAPAVERI